MDPLLIMFWALINDGLISRIDHTFEEMMKLADKDNDKANVDNAKENRESDLDMHP